MKEQGKKKETTEDRQTDRNTHRTKEKRKTKNERKNTTFPHIRIYSYSSELML